MSRPLVRQLNDLDLEELLRSHTGYVAVAFLAWMSIPCDHFRPEFGALALRLERLLGFRWIDVEENPDVTAKLGVEAVPTTLLFREGREVARWEGPYTREALEERIRAELERRAA